MNRHLLTAIIIALATSGCDLSTKVWAIQSTAQGPRSLIPGILDLVHRENPGMAFSLMVHWPASVRMIVLGGAALGAVAFGLYTAAKRNISAGATVAIGLIVGGALGNLVSRVQSGTVTDFLHVHRGSFDWPAFNVADMAVSCGAILLAFTMSEASTKSRA
jgi:signal peptidase II